MDTLGTRDVVLICKAGINCIYFKNYFKMTEEVDIQKNSITLLQLKTRVVRKLRGELKRLQ